MSADVLVETAKHFTELAQKAAGAGGKAAVLPLPEPDGTYAIVAPDGKVDRVKPGNKPIRHKLLSVDQVEHFVADYDSAEVWVSDKSVTVICDETQRQMSDRAFVELPDTAEWKALISQAATGESRQPKAAIKWLRTTFEHQTGDVETLIGVLRKIGAKVVTTTSAVTERTRESIGRDIDAEMVEQAGQIPDEISIAVRVYEDRALDGVRSVRCLVELDPQTCQIQILPRQSSINAAVEAELVRVTALCKQGGKPVFYGVPG